MLFHAFLILYIDNATESYFLMREYADQSAYKKIYNERNLDLKVFYMNPYIMNLIFDMYAFSCPVLTCVK